MTPKKIGLAAAAVASLAAIAVGGNAIADAASSSGSASTSYTSGPGTAGDRGGFGRGGAGHEHTSVSGDELAKVKDAVKAEDSAVTVQDVQQDPDGSYDVFGTKNRSPVMLEVSKDLKTVTENSGGPHGGPGVGQAPAQPDTSGSTPS